MIQRFVLDAWQITDYGRVLLKIVINLISSVKLANGDVPNVKHLEKNVPNVELIGDMINKYIYGKEPAIERKLTVYIWMDLCANIVKLDTDLLMENV